MYLRDRFRSPRSFNLSHRIGVRRIGSVKFDQLSRFVLSPQMLFLISTILYFSPYLAGGFDYIDFDGYRFRASYHSGTGFAIVLALLSIVLALMLVPVRRQDFSFRQDNQSEARVLILMIVIFGLMVLGNTSLYAVSKMDVLEGTGRIEYMFHILCIIGVLFSFLCGLKKNSILFCLSILGLIFTLYVGHRSSVAITIIGIGYIRYRNTSLFSMRKRYLIGIPLAFCILVLYKPLYATIKTGNVELILQRIEFDRLSDSAVIGLEQFVTFAHLDFIVANDYSLPCTNLWLVPFSVIPFLDSLIGEAECGFNEQVQPVFFSGYRGGVAANIWAEFFANFGYFGLPLLVLVIVTMALGLERIIGKLHSPVVKISFVVALVHVTVYLQRKELLGVMISAKRAVIVGLLVFGAAWLYQKVVIKRSVVYGERQRYRDHSS